MKILVTGGLGYIGSHTVVELLAEGYEVVIVDNLSNSRAEVLHALQALSGQRVAFYPIDCASEQAMEALFAEHPDIEGVIHFAALKSVGESLDLPLRYYQNNLGSLLATTAQLCKRGGAIVFSSSASVYGTPLHSPVTEETPLQTPTTPYGKTKLMGETILTDILQATPQVRGVILRYFNPIGAHPSSKIGEYTQRVPNNLMPYITQTVAGILPYLPVYGGDYNTPDGSAIRDYFHVVDLARAHVLALRAMQEQRGSNVEIINVGAGRGVSVLELIQTFEKVNHVKVPYKIVERRLGDVEAIYASIAKAQEVLGWQPRYTLADALAHAWQWQQQLTQMPQNFQTT